MSSTGWPARILTVLLFACLLLLGLVLGVLESFCYPWRFAGVPVGILAATVANLLAAQLAGRGAGSRAFAALPGVGWLLAAMALTVQRPEGDFVIMAGWYGYGYLLAGTVGAVIGIALTPLSAPRGRDHDEPYGAAAERLPDADR